MARKKKVEPQTLNEFKAWLEGVEELQDANWSPNRSQWLKIRARIDNIMDDYPEEEQFQPNVQYTRSAPIEIRSSLGDIPQQQIAAPVAPIIPAPQAPVIPAPSLPATPEILDTSDGEYQSGFE